MTRPVLKVYCEHSAISGKLRAHQRAGRIELVHFPYDPDSRSKHLKRLATPSLAQWRDMNVKWEELNFAWNDFTGSAHFQRIVSILGPDNRCDVLHVDSAFKTGCQIFVTCDNDILSKRKELESLLGMKFFHPNADEAELETRLKAS